jgi:hypothetical protein
MHYGNLCHDIRYTMELIVIYLVILKNMYRFTYTYTWSKWHNVIHADEFFSIIWFEWLIMGIMFS